MAKPVVPRAQAERDVEEALDHYLGEAGAEVALNFIGALEGAYRRLSEQPGIGSPRYAHELDLPGLRTWPLAGFPFLVFYIERDTHLDVARVLHSQRDIPAWLSL